MVWINCDRFTPILIRDSTAILDRAQAHPYVSIVTLTKLVDSKTLSHMLPSGNSYCKPWIACAYLP